MVAKISDFVQQVMKEFGERVIVDLTENLPYRIISTDSLALNLATRVGGIPTRNITEIFGADGAGKTTLSLVLSKNTIQNLEGRVLYIDVENRISPQYVKQILGFEPTNEQFILAKPMTSEDALSLAEIGIKHKIDLIILDSVGALTPQRERDADLDKDSYAGSAKLLARFLRRNMSNIYHNDVAFIFINQVRDKIGSFVGGYETPGGHSLKHFDNLRIFLSGLKSSKVLDQHGKQIGNYVRFRIEKNSLGIPNGAGEFPLIYGKGIDYILDVINTALNMKILIRRGSYIYLEDEQLAQGAANLRNRLENDQETLDKIVQLCYDKANMPSQISDIVMDEDDGKEELDA